LARVGSGRSLTTVQRTLVDSLQTLLVAAFVELARRDGRVDAGYRECPGRAPALAARLAATISA
jgi:hypothetical protein